jgi:8-oxo-dGTP diphosphatase
LTHRLRDHPLCDWRPNGPHPWRSGAFARASQSCAASRYRFRRAANAGIMRHVPALEKTMPYTPIVATLGYVLSEDRKRVLMIHRNARPGDHHLGKYNGLGGKVENDEDIVAGMRREIMEEAGIECVDLHLRGTISWPGFGKQGEDWFGFVFVVTRYQGIAFTENAEGSLEWIEVDKLLDLPLWDGDRHFLPLVFDTDARAFHGVMPYRDGRMQAWHFSRI